MTRVGVGPVGALTRGRVWAFCRRARVVWEKMAAAARVGPARSALCNSCVSGRLRPELDGRTDGQTDGRTDGGGRTEVEPERS